MPSAAVLERPITVPDQERAAMEDVNRQIDRLEAQATALIASLVGPNGEKVDLPNSIYRVLREIAPLMAKGDAIFLVPVHQVLTTQQAADLLNVSRQYLVRLLDRGDIPHTKAGKHRRVRFQDLMNYRQRRDAAREAALDEMDQFSQETGGYN